MWVFFYYYFSVASDNLNHLIYNTMEGYTMPVITQRVVELFTYNNLRKIHISVADPGSEERGRLRFWGLAPKIFLVNVCQFRGLFKVFGENRGRAPAAPPRPWNRHCISLHISHSPQGTLECKLTLDTCLHQPWLMLVRVYPAAAETATRTSS